MPAREEIREGIRKLIRKECCGGEGWKCDPSPSSRVDCQTCNQDIDEILSYLHSQGVVIKVDRELPEVLKLPKGHSIPAVLMVSLKEAGYVAVEPLI